MNWIWKISFVAFLLASVLACAPTPTVEERIEKEVEKRLEAFRAQKRESCKEYIRYEAEYLVDSIMYLEIGRTLKDALPIPEKPLRPDDSLAYSVDLDTSKVRSIFPDTSKIEGLKKE